MRNDGGVDEAQNRSTVVTVIVCLLFCVFAGCGEQQDPRILALRKRFLATDPIADATSVSSVLKTLQAGEAPESVPVVIRGRISAGDLPPWETGVAAFVLTDTTGHDEGDSEHDPHTCPFCSRHIEDYLAQIYFRDKDGKVIDIDSRELFDVKEGQTVNIKGSGRIGASGTLEVDASQLYIRR